MLAAETELIDERSTSAAAVAAAELEAARRTSIHRHASSRGVRILKLYVPLPVHIFTDPREQ